MNTPAKFKRLSILLLSSSSIFLAACVGDPMPTRDQIAEAYPEVDATNVAENKKIICPFVRMMERGGIFDGETDPETSTIAASTIVNTTKEFGCASSLCSPIANTTASAQEGPGGVNIEALHTAEGISHDCGFTFALGGSEVSDSVRQSTLDSLSELADENGDLTYSDIEAVKLAICEAQGVEISFIGESEAQLIFAFLGGVEQGTVAHSDVVKLLHAELPETISTAWLTPGLVFSVN